MQSIAPSECEPAWLPRHCNLHCEMNLQGQCQQAAFMCCPWLAGHSLGGAMANLAAYDIAKAVQVAGLQAHLACYTFGAPRTGNHAFAWDYRKTVPDTWGLINDQVSWPLMCMLVTLMPTDPWNSDCSYPNPMHSWRPRWCQVTSQVHS